MQRIKASGVVSVMPPVQENSYDPGYFSNGNPATDELATMMTAEWCNGVQEELLAVIQDAKLTPSGTDLKQLLQALKYFFSTSEAEKWRKAMIGSLVPMAVSSLPGGFGMPDGSLFLFEDYPELKEKYDAGGFNGMLLEANATAEDKAAWVGKWVKHSEGIGLYAPRLSGLFLRNAGTAGRSESSGLPSLNGRASFLYREDSNTEGVFSLVDGKGSVGNLVTPGSGSINIFWADLALNASSLNSIFGATSEVQPPNVNLVAGIYLGITS